MNRLAKISFLGRALFCIAAVSLLFSCIKRDNPWDPINRCHPDELLEFRDYYHDQIAGVLDSVTGKYSTVDSIRAEFNDFRNSCETVISNNEAVIKDFNTLQQENLLIEEQNDRLSDKSTALEKKAFDDTLAQIRLLESPVMSTILKTMVDALLADSVQLYELIETAQQQCPKRKVFSNHEVDSFKMALDSPLVITSRLYDSIETYNDRLIASNKSYRQQNDSFKNYNNHVAEYNEMVKAWKLPQTSDTSEISRKLDSLQAGDTLAIDTSELTIEVFRVDSISSPLHEWTLIVGKPGTRTRVRSSGAITSASNFIYYKNFIFDSMGNNVGARVIDTSNNITFENCIFQNNTKWGFEASGGSRSVRLINCIFSGNGNDTATDGSGGIRIAGCEDINADNILVVKNRGRGIEIHASSVRIDSATISDNTKDGINYTGGEYSGYFYSYYSIFSFNKGFGIYRNNEGTATTGISATSDKNWFFENDSGAVGGDSLRIVEENGGINVMNPGFVNREDDDYRVTTPYFDPKHRMGFQY